MTQREAFEAIYGKREKYHTTREWDAMLQAWNSATAAERERCASICDGIAEVCEASANGVRRVAGVNVAKSCASTIRMA